MLVRWEDLALDKVTEMVARKSIAGTHLTLTQMYLKKGALVPLHAHERETIIYVLQGALRARVSGQDLLAREGEVLIMPAGIAHQAESLEDTFILTVV